MFPYCSAPCRVYSIKYITVSFTYVGTELNPVRINTPNFIVIFLIFFF